MKNKSIVVAVIALVIVAAIVGVVAFGGKDTNNTTSSGTDMSNMNMNSNSTSTNAVATNSVEISNYAFSPATIKVKVGTKVTWTNKDTVEHSVVSDDSSSNGPDGPLLAKGKSYSFTFTKAGTFSYHCQPHPYMKATVIVTE